ncbi:O-Glycosyl hydrolases family 17 protein [Actinidia rufa]|uniref:O-Glycosyl hydrolases family 17 protein n=1 Tax=Actinidia rufa TaxID=165716 RepID=A0A7J0FMD8_9ERIC|nr:O-Glycosyl hydrolases family 17 protein [Actinidia rufa]
MATHKLPPKVVVQMLKDNGIQKVKLFDADQSTMSALAGSNLEVMVAIPNDQLAAMTNYNRAKQWVQRNITRYNFNGGVNINGWERTFSQILHNNSFLNITLPALQNIQNALNEAKVGDSIKATVPLNADVYESPQSNPVPSAGRFRSDINDLMTQIVQFLHQNNAPFFTVNIYPFLTLRAAGFGDMPILVGEVGWPTEGDKNANSNYALRFYNGLLPRLAAGKGTPLRPGNIEVYLFGLIDEDAKRALLRGISSATGEFSGTTGNPNTLWIFRVKHLGMVLRATVWMLTGNASYAFNMYFQVHNQEDLTCNFQGLATVTTQNISQGTCNFTIQIASSSSSSLGTSPPVSFSFFSCICITCSALVF